MKTIFISVIALLLIIFSEKIYCQANLNLDFERVSFENKPQGWFAFGDGFEIRIDTSIAYSGRNSVHIEKISKGNFGAASTNFPVDDGKGKHLRFTGYIKTNGITEGYAGLWWRVDGKAQGKTLGFDNMQGRGATGTSDWKQYSIEMKIDSAAQYIVFGVIMPGNGEAWFDNLQIELDGLAYTAFIISDEQLNWLKEKVIPFSSSDPSARMDELNKLEEIIGDAKIVALGEGTHGTSEFFKMKHRIVKFLAEKMDFTVFAIEANMPEARKINDYVLYGKGDAKEALNGIYFWTWNTQEVLDFIEWMREFNESGKGRIEFWGFDMQFPTVAMANVKAFVEKNDPEYLGYLNQAFTKIEKIHSATLIKYDKPLPGIFYGPWHDEAKKVLDHLQKNRKQYLSNNDDKLVNQVIQDARIVLQAADMNIEEYPSRDESMAVNTEWILDQFPADTKIILWAHNGHISRKFEQTYVYKPMGQHLSDLYGSQYFNLGFAFGDGKYNARGKNGLSVYGTSSPEPGSYEYSFRKTGINNFIFDLRELPNSPLSVWIDKSLLFRSIGAGAMDYAFFKTVLPKQFDGIIYFDQTTPSKLLVKGNSYN